MGGNFPLYIVDKTGESKKTILLFVGPRGTPAYQVGLKTEIKALGGITVDELWVRGLAKRLR